MTSISKNVNIDKLDDTINKHNDTYHSATKMKAADVKSNTHINSSKKIMMKILNLKLVMFLKHQNIKTFLEQVIFQIDLKRLLLLQKLKILFSGHMLFVI